MTQSKLALCRNSDLWKGFRIGMGVCGAFAGVGICVVGFFFAKGDRSVIILGAGIVIGLLGLGLWDYEASRFEEIHD